MFNTKREAWLKREVINWQSFIKLSYSILLFMCCKKVTKNVNDTFVYTLKHHSFFKITLPITFCTPGLPNAFCQKLFVTFQFFLTQTFRLAAKPRSFVSSTGSGTRSELKTVRGYHRTGPSFLPRAGTSRRPELMWGSTRGGTSASWRSKMSRTRIPDSGNARSLKAARPSEGHLVSSKLFANW